MINETDIKFNNIIECSNRILKFQSDLANAKTSSEKEHLNFLIEEQRKLIEEYTDISVDEILSSVEEINSIKQATELEKDSTQKELGELIAINLRSKLRSQICTSRSSQFRNTQKLDINPSVLPKEESEISEVKPKER